MVASDEAEFEMPNRGDDRPGLDDLDNLVTGEELDADDDLEEDDDYPEDATEDDIDLVIACYREDGQPVAVPLEIDLANDLDGLIEQLRRIPGDAGAVGMVSVASEVFVIVRVRGKRVQVFCSDGLAADDWPIVRDVADFLDAELPDDDSDDPYPLGDADILSDAGLPDFELEAMAEDVDVDSAVLLERIAVKLGFRAQFGKALASFE
ncbi:tRNA adenosine deaminase-associated protein [Propionicimonas sp.]|uniref:tRNA adenosine deaminase-associated protein n=1 Tax=Propionicimonas sp. TaxID=1955623 RepID=UPI0039E68623